MPRVKAGEMSLPEIRNLARQHNKASQIKDVDKLSRKALLNSSKINCPSPFTSYFLKIA